MLVLLWRKEIIPFFCIIMFSVFSFWAYSISFDLSLVWCEIYLVGSINDLEYRSHWKVHHQIQHQSHHQIQKYSTWKYSDFFRRPLLHQLSTLVSSESAVSILKPGELFLACKPTKSETKYSLTVEIFESAWRNSLNNTEDIIFSFPNQGQKSRYKSRDCVIPTSGILLHSFLLCQSRPSISKGSTM